MTRRMRSVSTWALAGAAILVAGMVATGGCTSKSTTPGPTVSPSATPTPSGSPTPTPSPTPTANVFVALDYPSVPPTTDPVYGGVQGFAPIPSPLITTSPSPIPTISSQIITVHCNKNIQFFNVDRTLPHTASLLGGATGMSWPLWNNVNGPQGSPLLTAITDNEFSTGTLFAFGSGVSSYSLVYTTGATTGSFAFGDYFNYSNVLPQMRTVITVVCP